MTQNRGLIQQRKLSVAEKTAIMRMLDSGFSKRRIARTLQCSRNTVLRYARLDNEPRLKSGVWPEGVRF
jgi:DNA-binding NarL/FixJ family response regulator